MQLIHKAIPIQLKCRYMKDVLLFFVMSILLTQVSGQTPQGFNYQGVIRDDSNKPVSDKDVALQFTIRQGSLSGTSI